MKIVCEVVAAAHPEQGLGDGLLTFYNVNAFDASALHANASLHRPRFVRVALGCLPR
jgi:hypothetical protein